MTFRIKEKTYPICDVYLTYQLEYWQRHEFHSFGRYIEISMIFIKKNSEKKKEKWYFFILVTAGYYGLCVTHITPVVHRRLLSRSSSNK